MRYLKFIPLASIAALAALFPGTASAHITTSSANPSAGSYSLITINVSHGCEDSPTKSISVKIPQDEFLLPAVTPYENPAWTVEKKMGKLSEPAELHGTEITEGVSEITWTRKTPLDAHTGDLLTMSVKLPDDAAGKTMYFPIIQKCTKGQTDWVEIPEEGGEEPEHPAASLAITEASGDGHGGAAPKHGDDEGEEEDDGADKPLTHEHVHEEIDQAAMVAGIALMLGLLGLLLWLYSWLKARPVKDAKPDAKNDDKK